jgi:hypothetical protein
MTGYKHDSTRQLVTLMTVGFGSRMIQGWRLAQQPGLSHRPPGCCLLGPARG